MTPETAPCPACGRKCHAVTSESGKYSYLRCDCGVMTMVPTNDKVVVEPPKTETEK